MGNLLYPGKCSLSFEKFLQGRHPICGKMDIQKLLNVPPYARMIESGFGAVSKKWDANDLLAATSGLFLFVATTHLQASALTARALLAAWSFSGNWIDWQRKFNDIAAGSKKE